MENKIAGALTLFGAIILICIWWVFLFAARPECAESIDLAISSAKYALTPSESGTWLFVYTIISIAICLICSAILFTGRVARGVMYIIAGHALASLFIYTWSLVVAIALPLIYFGKVGENA